MTKEEKNKEIDALVEILGTHSSFYITDFGTMNAEKTSKLRRLCFQKDIGMRVAKNSLIQKALERMGPEYADVIPTLKGSSAILNAEAPNTAAKAIKEFRKAGDRPLLKVAYIDSAIFAGDNHLDALGALKSKNELIGEIIGLLQSPAKNVVSALKSSGGKLAGILKTLGAREEKAA